MVLADYDPVYRIWAEAEGMCLGEDDSRGRIRLYLGRNPGLCFVATSGKGIVGTVLCGHDGRRGILRHLAVVPGFRKQGVGRALTARCLAALSRSGIRRCNLYVEDNNPAGIRFWEHLGFRQIKDDYRTFQIRLP
jgi:ribosomal protein S18 acetylase RimI-like enzyme